MAALLIVTGSWWLASYSNMRSREAFLGRAKLCMQRRDYGGAIQWLNKVGPDGKLGFEAVLLSGECLVRSGRFVEALDVLHYAAEREPDSGDAHRWLAACYYDLGGVADAVDALTRVTKLDPTDIQTRRLLGKIYRSFLREADAAEQLEAAVAIPGADSTSAATALVELADLYVFQGFYDKADGVLARFRSVAAENCDSLALDAQCRYAQHNVDAAIQRGQRALELNAKCAPALQLLARVFLENGEPDRAAEFAERAVQLRKEDHKSRHILAQAYRRLERFDEAAREEQAAEHTYQLFDRLTELTKTAMHQRTDAPIRLEIARLWIELERFDMAATWTRAALACDGSLQEARQLQEEILLRSEPGEPETSDGRSLPSPRR